MFSSLANYFKIYPPLEGGGIFRKVPWITLGLSGIMIALYGMGQNMFDLLVLDKEALRHGELWRFFTGHFVHFNFDHILWDLLAFLILGTVIELHHRRYLIFSLLVSCVVVSLWICFGTTISAYCGLSGALSGLLVIAAMIQWKKSHNKIFIYVVLATIGKIIFELMTQQTIFTNLSSKAVPTAHAAGFVAGFICLFFENIKIKREKIYANKIE
ncbi:hypothetical protein MNBD_UNCLBAC01-94 [hydrothermal vent metagenome]|uniref:Peptidase S54 rhomboid domain-containing protein n=1 Tax=hydrothermal vent metagenome TaxID=652676 RepID=A0A3B1DIM7_9ZZZZ